MIPSVFDGGPKSEEVVWQALKYQLPNDWIVLHSKRFVLRSRPDLRPIEGECDFVVLDPQKGLIGLEVKGGLIGRDVNGWFSISREGYRNPIKDPGKQSQNAVHQIAGFLDRSGNRLPYAWGVVFPDSARQALIMPG